MVNLAELQEAEAHRRLKLLGTTIEDESLEAVCKVVLKWLEKSTEQEKRDFLSSAFLRGLRSSLHTTS